MEIFTSPLVSLVIGPNSAKMAQGRRAITLSGWENMCVCLNVQIMADRPGGGKCVPPPRQANTHDAKISGLPPKVYLNTRRGIDGTSDEIKARLIIVCNKKSNKFGRLRGLGSLGRKREKQGGQKSCKNRGGGRRAAFAPSSAACRRGRRCPGRLPAGWPHGPSDHRTLLLLRCLKNFSFCPDPLASDTQPAGSKTIPPGSALWGGGDDRDIRQPHPPVACSQIE